jgi:N-acetylglucosaminyl-diphospho-decaprenol L-rhamnosyltransferase
MPPGNEFARDDLPKRGTRSRHRSAPIGGAHPAAAFSLGSVKEAAGSPRCLSVVDDLAIITVSTNEAKWLRPCLSTVFAHLGDLRADVVVADNDSEDGTRELVASEFPRARVVASRNHGFSHANNRALMTCNARYVLFLNPDTEILEGKFSELVRAMDERPTVGLIGVRQITPDGTLDPTIRYFPNALRALGEALATERLPRRPRWLGERELDLSAYDHEFACDWTTGSFMLARREAIESAGYLDERYFVYSEETDLCRRIKTAGWEVRHVPSMTILHHDGKAGVKPSIVSLGAWNRVAYARKHFSPVHRATYSGAVMLGYALRSVFAGRGEQGRLRRQASRQALATLVGRSPVPHAPRTSRVSVQTAAPELREAPRSDQSSESEIAASSSTRAR